MSIFQRLKRGNQYMNLWPEHAVLKAVFQDVRVREMMKVARMVIPPAFALLLFWIYYICGGIQGLHLLFAYPSSGSMMLYMVVTSLIIMAMALLLLPVHGLLWFAYRAEIVLDVKQKEFYSKLMRRVGQEPVASPTMYDLAFSLHEAFRVLKERDFLEEL